MRNSEIAEVLGIDERTVASHLCRAIEETAADILRIYQERMSADRAAG